MPTIGRLFGASGPVMQMPLVAHEGDMTVFGLPARPAAEVYGGGWIAFKGGRCFPVPTVVEAEQAAVASHTNRIDLDRRLLSIDRVDAGSGRALQRDGERDGAFGER
jgi:hypothetical protein